MPALAARLMLVVALIAGHAPCAFACIGGAGASGPDPGAGHTPCAQSASHGASPLAGERHGDPNASPHGSGRAAGALSEGAARPDLASFPDETTSGCAGCEAAYAVARGASIHPADVEGHVPASEGTIRIWPRRPGRRPALPPGSTGRLPHPHHETNPPLLR